MNGLTRRSFLSGAVACAPCALSRRPVLRWLPGGDDRSLIVLELAGGNDGLNTLIPIEDPAWARARPTLSNVRDGALAVADGFALHPSMRELHALFERGLCCAVHGVGYTPPDRSHFRSRDIWYTADPSHTRVGGATTGWLGRAADELAARGAAVPSISVGSLAVPLVLRGERVVAPSLRRLDDYRLIVDPRGDRQEVRREQLRELVADVGVGVASGAAGTENAQRDLRAFIGAVSKTALDSEARLERALRGYRPHAEFPDGRLGDALRLVSQVVVSGFGTRLFHLSFDGFDTHARQAPAHAGLLRQLSRGLGALIDDLQAHGALSRVALLVYSEFGRRVRENRSQGTDHGAAAPVFVLAEGLRGSFAGTRPDLSDLSDGDVRPTTDFRGIYAALCGRLGVPAEVVLGGRHAPVPLW